MTADTGETAGENTRAAIEVSGLGVSLGGAEILHAVHLSVQVGEWVALVGPNGAGKSTLLRTIAGLVRAGSGTVRVHGRPLAELRPRERARSIALVAQLPEVPIGMSVRDYVLLGRTPHLAPLHREGQADHRIVDAVLGQLELRQARDRLLTTMSGGELQRVFLARALAQQPSVLLLDEPTSALDIGHQQEVLEIVDRLRQTLDLSVLTTVHDLTLAGQYADRVVVLDQGRVAADGRPDRVLTRELLESIYRVRVAVVPADETDGLRGPAIIGLRP